MAGSLTIDSLRVEETGSVRVQWKQGSLDTWQLKLKDKEREPESGCNESKKAD